MAAWILEAPGGVTGMFGPRLGQLTAPDGDFSKRQKPGGSATDILGGDVHARRLRPVHAVFASVDRQPGHPFVTGLAG